MPVAILSALAVAVAQCGAPPAKALPPDLASLVEAERSFARASLDTGVRAAFLRYLADDAIVFRPQPVPAKKWYARQPASSAILVWEPEYVDVSASNDLGFTVGPYVLRADSTAAPSFGHFASVWRRGADREWKVVVDVGASHERVERPQFVATPSRDAAAEAVTQQEALAAIQQEERDFIEAATRGIEDAFDMWGSDDVRVMRAGALPTVGKEKARALLMTQPGTRRMTTTAAEASKGGDLGFTYGRCDVTHNDQVTTSYYVRVWKRMPDGAWKFVLDAEQ